MKRTGFALIFCVMAGACNALTLDAAAEARARNFQEDFRTGAIPYCTMFEFSDGYQWLLTSVSDKVGSLHKL
jgi:hypothetical protein